MGLLKDFKKSQPGGLLEGFRESKEQPEGGLLSGFRTEAIPSGAPSISRPRMEEFTDAAARGLARIMSAAETARAALAEPKFRMVGYRKFPVTPPQKKAMRARAAEIRKNAEFLWKLSQNPALAAQNKDLLSKALNLIGETLPYITATTAAFITTGPMGAFAVGSMVEGNSAYRTALDAGVPEDKAKKIGVAVGMISGAVEAFGGKYAEQLAIKSIAKVKSKIMKAGAVFTIGTVIEALEEGTQEVAQITGEATYRDIDWSDASIRVLGSMAGGAFLGGLMKGGGVTVRQAVKGKPQVEVDEKLEEALFSQRAFRREVGGIVEKAEPPVARAARVPEGAKEGKFTIRKIPIAEGEITGYVAKGQRNYWDIFDEKGDWIERLNTKKEAEDYIEERLSQPPAAGVEEAPRKPLIPQPTAIVKSSFSEWATDFSATRAQDLGVPLLLNDPKIAKWRLSTLKEIENAQRRFKKTYQKKLARRESPNVFNPWISARHAFMSLGEKTGVPLYHIYDNIMRKGGAANIKGFEEISSRIGIGELSKLTMKDNAHIAEWLFSPKTRLRVSSEISPDTLKMAKKLDEILQGPAAKQVQEMVARRWIKSGKAPPDIWNYPTDVIVNKWMMELKEKKSIPKIVRSMLVSGIPNQTKLKGKIARAASREGWSAADERFAFTVLSSKRVQAEITAMQGYPKKVFDKASEAKENKVLPELIANADPWTRGLGVRKFYYLSDPIKADIIDDYIDSISLRALEKPAIPEGSMPGTISYEAYAREGHPGIKKGSVVNNVLTHLQRVSIANAVADDMETMYDRLTQKVKDPLTGKDTARIPLSDSDSKTVKDIFNNLLMKRQIATRPWAIAVDVKRWFWRTRLSMIARPDATLWMSFRNALQNLGMGPTAFNVKQTSKSMLKYASKTAQGNTMEEIDPQMYARFRRDFTSYVSQRRAFYREFLLQDTANVSREFGNRRVAQKAASLLERTGGMYGAVDEYVNRMPLWIAQYQTTKDAAIRYKFGKIDIKSFLAKSGLDTVRSEQKMMAQDLLDAGRINDLAAESANWMVEDVNLKYKTAERAGVEQTMSQRIFMGIYTFPRGAMELLSYRGIIPMMKGIETGNWNQAKHGLVNTLKGLAAGELAAVILMAVMGKSAYDAWSKNRYELLGPGAGTIADLFGSISSISYQLGQGDMTLDQAGDRLADAFAKNVDEFIPLMKIFSNTVETHYDTKSLNSWKLLRDTTSRKVLGKHVKWDYVSRSDYEKVMHLLIGSYEDPEGHVDVD